MPSRARSALSVCCVDWIHLWKKWGVVVLWGHAPSFWWLHWLHFRYNSLKAYFLLRLLNICYFILKNVICWWGWMVGLADRITVQHTVQKLVKFELMSFAIKTPKTCHFHQGIFLGTFYSKCIWTIKPIYVKRKGPNATLMIASATLASLILTTDQLKQLFKM